MGDVLAPFQLVFGAPQWGDFGPVAAQPVAVATRFDDVYKVIARSEVEAQRAFEQAFRYDRATKQLCVVATTDFVAMCRERESGGTKYCFGACFAVFVETQGLVLADTHLADPVGHVGGAAPHTFRGERVPSLEFYGAHKTVWVVPRNGWDTRTLMERVVGLIHPASVV